MSYLSDCITAGRPYEWGRFDIADTTLQFVVQHYTELAQDPEALAASPRERTLPSGPHPSSPQNCGTRLLSRA